MAIPKLKKVEDDPMYKYSVVEVATEIHDYYKQTLDYVDDLEGKIKWLKWRIDKKWYTNETGTLRDRNYDMCVWSLACAALGIVYERKQIELNAALDKALEEQKNGLHSKK